MASRVPCLRGLIQDQTTPTVTSSTAGSLRALPPGAGYRDPEPLMAGRPEVMPTASGGSASAPLRRAGYLASPRSGLLGPAGMALPLAGQPPAGEPCLQA